MSTKSASDRRFAFWVVVLLIIACAVLIVIAYGIVFPTPGH